LHELVSQKGAKIQERHLIPDHVYKCLSFAPKYAVSNVAGYIKRKYAITIERKYSGRARNFRWEAFLAGGYFSSTEKPLGFGKKWVRD
jgi:putative transposase